MWTFIFFVVLFAILIGVAYLTRSYGWKGMIGWIVAAGGAVVAWFQGLIPSPEGWF